MAPIVSSIEIARPPEEVFDYLIDPSHLAEWQESLVSARAEASGPPRWARGSSRSARSVAASGR
jgi:uncharacterized protein YndB with AHSA1/START domain